MGILELIFVALLIGKLAGWFVISWWWVFAPLIPAAIIYLIVLGVFGITFFDIMKGDK